MASSAISRLRRYQLSSASIRNVMSELADDGYLSQPHHSAGRVPTPKAFQKYVQGLESKRPHKEQVSRIREELSEAGSLNERIERCTNLLTEMTQSVGITAAIPAAAQVLDRIELIPLSEHRVLMIVVTEDKLVSDKVVFLEEAASQSELETIRNYVNQNFSGWVIADVHAELRRRLQQASAAYDEILRKLVVLYRKGLLAIQREPEVRMEGASNLVSFDFHFTRERLREMFRALEEKKRLLELLEKFLEQPAGKVGVKVGLGEEDSSLGQLSLIGIQVASPGGISAKFAVLGPMRMDYERAVSAVLHVGRAFTSLPS